MRGSNGKERTFCGFDIEVTYKDHGGLNMTLEELSNLGEIMNNKDLKKRTQELQYLIAMKAGHRKRLLEEVKGLDDDLNMHLEELSNLGEDK